MLILNLRNDSTRLCALTAPLHGFTNFYIRSNAERANLSGTHGMGCWERARPNNDAVSPIWSNNMTSATDTRQPWPWKNVAAVAGKPPGPTLILWAVTRAANW